MIEVAKNDDDFQNKLDSDKNNTIRPERVWTCRAKDVIKICFLNLNYRSSYLLLNYFLQ